MRGCGVRPTSYVAALTSGLPAAHSSTLARSHIRDSQVLIDKDPQVSSNHLDTLNKQELVTKANEVLGRMAMQVSPGPNKPR